MFSWFIYIYIYILYSSIISISLSLYIYIYIYTCIYIYIYTHLSLSLYIYIYMFNWFVVVRFVVSFCLVIVGVCHVSLVLGVCCFVDRVWSWAWDSVWEICGLSLPTYASETTQVWHAFACMCIYIYIYICSWHITCVLCVYIHVCVYIYIYIYIQREREREYVAVSLHTEANILTPRWSPVLGRAEWDRTAGDIGREIPYSKWKSLTLKGNPLL